MVYFVQGVLGLARLAVSFYLKDDLHLDPAETAVITGLSSLPWLVKPLYGFIRYEFFITSIPLDCDNCLRKLVCFAVIQCLYLVIEGGHI
jgi:hypothetical protein